MPDKLILRTTSSLVNQWSKCPTSGHYHDDLSLGLPDVKQDQGRTKGTMMHAILEVYYQLIMWSDFNLANIEIEAIKYGRRKAVELPLTVDGVETVIEAAKAYFEYYKYDTMKPMAVEQPFSKLFYEDDIERVIDNIVYSGVIVLMEGKKDLIGEIQGRRYIVDHKTESRKDFTSPLSNQFMCYSWSDPEIREVLVNKVGLQTSVAPKEKFIRKSLSYTSENIEEWYNNTLHELLNVLEYKQAGLYPKKFTSCTGKYGICQYHDICAGVPSDRQRIMNVRYEIKPAHDPFDETDG